MIDRRDERLYEPERRVIDEQLALDCTIYGHCPVQADGKLQGYPLYFRARWNAWSFHISLNPNVDGSCVDEGKEPGFCGDGEFQGFVLWGDYGDDFAEAGWMWYADAERIIRDSAAQFREAMQTRMSS